MIEALAIAIATFEGFFIPNSRAQRNMNPGNLRAGPRAIGKDDAGYAIYPSMDAGWADLRRQIERNIGRGVTLLEFFTGKPGVYAGYAPAADQNHPLNYARFVADKTGLALDTPLDQQATGPPDPSSGRT